MAKRAKTIIQQDNPSKPLGSQESSQGEIPTKQELEEFYQEAWEAQRAEDIDPTLTPKDSSFKARMKATIALIKPKKEETVILDLGCGIGLYDFYILKKIKNSTVLGIDISHKQIRLATELSKKVDSKRIAFKVLDVEKIDEKELGGFSKPNYILATEILEHLVDPKPFLRKVKNLCTEKTRIIFSVPLPYFNKNGNVWYIQKQGEKTFETQDQSQLLADQKYYRVWHKEYPISELISLLEEEGFKIRKIKGSLFRPIKTTNPLVYSAMSKLTFNYPLDNLLNKVTQNKFARTVVLKCSLK